MRTLRFFVGILFVSSLLSAQSLALHDDELVTLQSEDGQDFKIEVKVAQQSVTLKNLIEDAGTGKPIPLPDITSKTLSGVIDLLKRLKGGAGEPSLKKRKVTESTEESLPELIANLWGHLWTTDLFEIVRAVNYLDIRKELEGDVLNATLGLYGDRLFGRIELVNLGWMARAAAYTNYAATRLALPKELQRIIVKQSLRSIDRIFLDTSPDRRLHAIDATPLDVAQIIAYIAENQTPRASELPEALREVLQAWDPDFARKIHFGPWPTEFATWPGHCPLPSNANYNMYSDATPEDRFIDNGDGTVTDVCTKLTWEQTPSTGPAPLQRAQNHCNKLVKADFKDWRAPTRTELQSIVNYAANHPALNSIFNERNAQYWSSTHVVGGENEAWTVDFEGGLIRLRKVGDHNRIRCVRGERGGHQTVGAKNHYAYAERSQTVRDNFTGAVWQRRVIDQDGFYAEAPNYCRNLTLDGSGWLLPTVKSLSTLIDVTVDELRIDRDAFPATPGHWFWSSSPRVRSPTFAWGVSFGSGLVNDVLVDVPLWARCVR